MDPLSITASIVSILQLSNTVLGYLNDVKNASKDRAKCAVEASNLNSLLLSLRFRLEEGSFKEPWYITVRALGVENGPLDQFKQALEELQAKLTGGGRLKKVGDALAWKLSKEEVTNILARIERLKTLVQVALQMDHFKLCQAIKECTDITHSNIEVIRTHIPTIESGLDVIRQEQNRTCHQKLMEWISPTDFPAQQSNFIARREQGTGQWFLDAPEFTDWLHGPKTTLFCPGIPGAGKTMMTAIAIEHLSNMVWSGAVGVAYVYCNYKAQVDQNPAALLAAILKQLVQARPSIVEPIELLHNQHSDRGTKPSLEEIFAALQSVLANYSSVYVAIDALDECPDRDGTRRQFLAKLRDLQGRTDMRLFATSRFIPEIVDEFNASLMLEVRASDGDIKRFVAGQTYRLPKCIQRDNALQKMVQDKVMQAVGGMFLLARLHVDSLLDKRTKSKVHCTLEKLCRGSTALDKAYENAIERIKGQLPEDSALATNVLSWIIHAQRPLTTVEICHALAVRPDDKELDLDNIPDVEDIVSVCAGLVTVDKESTIIRLVHYTTQEYFEQIQEMWNPRAQVKIASTCLTYLSFGTFKNGSCLTDKDFKKRLVQNAFLDYAARHWGHHTLKFQEEVCELACSFLQHDGLVSCAMQVMSSSNNSNYSQYFSKKAIGLHLTSQFGLLYLSEELSSRSGRDVMVSVNSKNSNGQTPLWLAAEYGHDSVVKLLIDKGAKVNTQNGNYGNALYVASLRGYELIVELLLEKGAQVNAQGGGDCNALQAASAKGHEVIVKLLLRNGAEINTRCGDYVNAVNTVSALYAASHGGHEQIVKLLLDKGADVSAQGGDYGNALQAASAGGHEPIVKLLLDKGADVNAQGGYFGNALQAASASGHERIVKLLLDKGAKANAQAGNYGNALYAASAEGHELIVKILLDKGAEVIPQVGDYGNALQAASDGGHMRIVKLLLEKGADVNAQGGYYGNALQAASAEGHEQIVILLLDKGADVNAQGGDYGNALQVASDGGHEQIVKLLLEKGADVNAQGGDYGNALQAASAGGHEKIVKLLLEKRAEINEQGGEYGNALYAASRGGHEQIVMLLIDKGAEVNAEGGDYGNALQAASAEGHQQIVKLLLDFGAEINAHGGDFGNALYAASRGGHEQISKLLLDKGADVNAQGGDYGNALQAASAEGHEHIVKLLLEWKVEVNAQGGDYGNALDAASAEGHEQIVRLLLENGAEIIAQGGHNGNAPKQLQTDATTRL